VPAMASTSDEGCDLRIGCVVVTRFRASDLVMIPFLATKARLYGGSGCRWEVSVKQEDSDMYVKNSLDLRALL
jgi:hypothetical protein